MKSQNNFASVFQTRYLSLTIRNVLAIMVVLGMTMFAAPSAQAGFNVIHNFSDGGDGATPYGGLTIDPGGNLLGTTSTGGFGGYGTVYKMSFKKGTWLLGTLYTFTNGNDGAAPAAGVIRDSSGVLYGSTYVGGANGYGTVFQLEPPSKASASVVAPWVETTLYSFTGASDGGLPDMLEV
jgi:uncharacterized repeat protein (TIGR03803 family)